MLNRRFSSYVSNHASSTAGDPTSPGLSVLQKEISDARKQMESEAPSSRGKNDGKRARRIQHLAILLFQSFQTEEHYPEVLEEAINLQKLALAATDLESHSERSRVLA